VGETIADVSRRVVERADVRWDEGTDGRITVRRRRYGAVRARVAAMAGVPADFTVHLDPLGSAAWHLIDGVRTVADLRRELERTHPAEGDLGPRVGKFVGAMLSHEMIRLL
jgi:hypothetical protein